MSVWLRISVWCLPIFLVGCFVGLASGAVGVCGDGGWGLIPFFLGVAALITFCVTFSTWLVRSISFRIRRRTS